MVSIISIAINISTAAIIIILYRRLKEKEEIVSSQSLTQEQQAMMLSVQSEEAEETWNELKKIRHDYTNHLICIREHLKRSNEKEALEYVESLLCGFKGEYGTKKIGNSFVDMFLSYKVRKEKEKNITFKTDIVIPRELPFDEVDLCIILGNALDNAVEAVKKLPEKERYIGIAMNYKRHTLKIVIENSFDGNVKKNRKGHLLTTKINHHNHGTGIVSMEKTVRKYDGLVDVSYAKNLFRLKALLYEK